uniref:RNA-directed RNA polymerase n=1 Tax=Haerbin Reovi tick virus 1 TaxID=2972310 RepID=A0A9E7V273_9REOV|nr:MAG: VP1 [Haerbin Reovi tick virus 1]
MCLNFALFEINSQMVAEEKAHGDTVEFDRPGGKMKIKMIDVANEFFLSLAPNPKKVNNMLRAVYSWLVKVWGIAQPELIVLASRGSGDLNAKNVIYDDFITYGNPYCTLIEGSVRYAESLSVNLGVVSEVEQFLSDALGHSYKFRFLREMLKTPYHNEFDPRSERHHLFLSTLLSLQAVTGFGRAWIKNVSQNPDDFVKPTEKNLVQQVSDLTCDYVVQALREAREKGFHPIPASEMYPSLMRLAKTTSAGMSTKMKVKRKFGVGQSKFEEFTTRLKSAVIVTHGDQLFSDEMLDRRFDTVTSYQTRGSRDVVIKATRTIYAIHVGVLAAQMIISHPLNEYLARNGGSTSPEVPCLAGKVISGELENTGSRIIDNCDTFAASSDPTLFTIALDYSSFDEHMTPHNFREGQVRGFLTFASEYPEAVYEGRTLAEMVMSGYGEGRVTGSLWSGTPRVFRVPTSVLEARPVTPEMRTEDWRKPFLRVPGGVEPIAFATEADHVPDGDVLVTPVDGSTLAKVYTHLSGENSTLSCNSLHNMAIGTLIQREVRQKHPGAMQFLSEMYVGDDTLFYTRLLTREPTVFDGVMDTIFATVERCGHVASAAKTVFAPFSVEKTQTHAKQGVYIYQDRMMIISSETDKNVESTRSYFEARVGVFITKCARGFSEELAMRALQLEIMLQGARRFKNLLPSLGEGERLFLSPRMFHSVEDGYTLVIVRAPEVLFLPTAFGGAGVHPAALNVKMTYAMWEVTFLDVMLTSHMRLLHPFLSRRVVPHWDERSTNTRGIEVEARSGLCSRILRPVPARVVKDQDILQGIRHLNLRGFGPTELGTTLLRSAALKERRARQLISAGYEKDYGDEWNEGRVITFMFPPPNAGSMELDSRFARVLDCHTRLLPLLFTPLHPDRTLSGSFAMQRGVLGMRGHAKIRLSAADEITSILQRDVVMRGLITTRDVLMFLAQGISLDDPGMVSMGLQLMNISPRVADSLARYVTSTRLRIDTVDLVREGAIGDEFSMSLNCFRDPNLCSRPETPMILQDSETAVFRLHAAQLRMLYASVAGRDVEMSFVYDSRLRKKFADARVRVLGDESGVSRLLTPNSRAWLPRRLLGHVP